jgi:hypothetical protein
VIRSKTRPSVTGKVAPAKILTPSVQHAREKMPREGYLIPAAPVQDTNAALRCSVHRDRSRHQHAGRHVSFLECLNAYGKVNTQYVPSSRVSLLDVHNLSVPCCSIRRRVTKHEPIAKVDLRFSLIPQEFRHFCGSIRTNSSSCIKLIGLPEHKPVGRRAAQLSYVLPLVARRRCQLRLFAFL